MGKLTNLKYPLKYTSTDFIAYTGELPACIPSGTSSCEPMNRSLTKLFQLILEKYCEPSANPLEVDISEIDIECLIEANPDIEIGEGLNLQDLLVYYKEHLCYIYERLCEECLTSEDLTCTIEVSGEEEIQEVTGSFCSFIQDHENRIFFLETQEPSSNPYIPEILTIPINKVINVQTQTELFINFEPYIKYNDEDNYYVTDNEDGTKYTSLIAPSGSILGDNGALWIDNSIKTIRYKKGGEFGVLTGEGEDLFSLWVTNGEGSNYPFPVSIYSFNACCDTDPSGEGIVQEFIITFNVTGWNNESQFNSATIESIDSTPFLSGVTATTETGLILRLQHNMNIIGSYMVFANYTNSTQVINVVATTPDSVDIQMTEAYLNIEEINVEVKVQIIQ